MVDISGSYGKLKRWVNRKIAAIVLSSLADVDDANKANDKILQYKSATEKHEYVDPPSGSSHTDHQIASTESASFKEVTIAINEAYKQGTDIILRIKGLNAFVGIDAGKITTGNDNNFIGYRAGYSNSTGYSNGFIGFEAGYSNTTGYRNNFIGTRSGYKNTTGHRNSFIGGWAGYSNISGLYNNFMGYQAGFYNTIGYNNNFMGMYAGHANTSGYYNNFMGYEAGFKTTTGYDNNFVGARSGYGNISGYYNTYVGRYAGNANAIGTRNIFIGSAAGYYETGKDKLFIDSRARANEADARVKALIYGVFDVNTVNQILRINGILQLTEIKSGNTQANAGAAANEVWKTASHASLPDNVLIIGV